jgi:hypothetical protein
MLCLKKQYITKIVLFLFVRYVIVVLLVNTEREKEMVELNRQDKLNYRQEHQALLIDTDSLKVKDSLKDLIKVLWSSFVADVIYMDEFLFRAKRVLEAPKYKNTGYSLDSGFLFTKEVYDLLAEDSLKDAVELLKDHPTTSDLFTFTNYTCSHEGCTKPNANQVFFHKQPLCEKHLRMEYESYAEEEARQLDEADKEADRYFEQRYEDLCEYYGDH